MWWRGCNSMPPGDLDSGLLATDSQIVAVQVIDTSGAVVRASAGAPHDPLVPPALFSRPRNAVPAEQDDGADVRVSGQPAERLGTRYTVLIGADSHGVDSTFTIVAVLLAIAMPIVVAGAAAATFVGQATTTSRMTSRGLPVTRPVW